MKRLALCTLLPAAMVAALWVCGLAYAQQAAENPAAALSANAGPDRIVMEGGKTYLHGWAGYGNPRGEGRRRRPTTAPAAAPVAPAPTVAWSKESGPGDVTFEKADAPVTTATFSAVGQYTLKLTATAGSASASATVAVVVEPPPPAHHLGLVQTHRYKLNSPLWNQRAKALIVSWIPHCYEKCSDLSLREGGIDNFVQAANKLAGKPFKPHVGYPFSNAWVHNTLESMCVAMLVDPQGDQQIIDAQKAMRAKIDEWIPIILAAQEPDGYLQTRITLGYANEKQPAERWSPRLRGEHEGYVAGYFIEAAIAHYLMTDGKDTRLYDAAKKLADCWCNNLGPAPKKHWFDGHQEMEQALVRFGRFVNEVEGAGKGQKYIELAKFLLDCRGDGGGGSYDQSHLPVVQQYEALGHAVRAAYTYAGMTDVAMETGDTDYRSAVRSLWDNLVNRKYYVTGGIGSGETSEGFGGDYSLRNNAYCESCSNCGMLFMQHKLNLMYHDARYADLSEDILYNAILGDFDLEGKNFYYQNPLDGSGFRYPWHGCPCCVGNIPRVLLMLPTWMYMKDDDGLYVNQFVGSTVTIDKVAGTSVEMVQATDYPWNGKVAMTVNPAAEKQFAIRIRVPSRGVSTLYTGSPDVGGITSIAVNGTAVKPQIKNGYAVLNRSWKAGDKIELELPLKPQRIKASPKIAADRGKVALRYGPLIYNIESVDQDINQVLAPDASLTTEWKPDLLQGVVVIKGKFADGSEMTAIPNYARYNRTGPQGDKKVRSNVWIRDE